MVKTVAQVPTRNGSKYLTQICKHWAHKLDVQVTGDVGMVRFPDALATMAAGPHILTVTLEAQGLGTVERLKGVLATHLDRFAFREAPLSFNWSAV
jgi:hypothetical protein